MVWNRSHLATHGDDAADDAHAHDRARHGRTSPSAIWKRSHPAQAFFLQGRSCPASACRSGWGCRVGGAAIVFSPSRVNGHLALRHQHCSSAAFAQPRAAAMSRLSTRRLH